MGEGVLYNIIFTKLLFKTVSHDPTAFHRIPETSAFLVYSYTVNVSQWTTALTRTVFVETMASKGYYSV